MDRKEIWDDGIRGFWERRINGLKNIVDAKLDLLQSLMVHQNFDNASDVAYSLSEQLKTLNRHINVYCDHTDGTHCPESLRQEPTHADD